MSLIKTELPSLLRQYKLQHQIGGSHYFFPLHVTAEFGSLPETKKERRKTIKEIIKTSK